MQFFQATALCSCGGRQLFHGQIIHGDCIAHIHHGVLVFFCKPTLPNQNAGVMLVIC